MSKETQIYFARKFFPHLLLPYALGSVQAVLNACGIPFEPYSP